MGMKLHDLGARVAREEDAWLLAREGPSLSKRLDRLHEAMAKRNPSLRPTRVSPLVLSFAALGAVAWGVFSLAKDERPLTMAVGHPREPLPAATKIAFSDGSRVALEADGAARVLSLAPHGATLSLERGTLHVVVVPHAANNWDVVAGPFRVHVTGTEFDVTFTPEGTGLRVVMTHGRVVVSGSCLHRSQVVSAGETFSTSCPLMERARQEVTQESLSVSPSTSPAPMPPALSPARTTPTVASSVETKAEAPHYRDLARAGRYHEAVRSAKEGGLSVAFGSAARDDLHLLADAARLSGDGATAEQAYLALRQRFPTDPASRRAAFHLGKLAFDGSHAFGKARSWFLTYLAEEPSGPLAAEALGRLLECEHALGNQAAAKATATRYLEQHPEGAHARIARSILDTP